MPTENIITRFTQAGVPTTGLSAVISIFDLNSGTPATPVVDAEAMLPLGLGLYYYPFTTFDVEHEYVIQMDGSGTITSAGERYKWSTRKFHNGINGLALT
jgi:hypothetical protein